MVQVVHNKNFQSLEKMDIIKNINKPLEHFVKQ